MPLPNQKNITIHREKVINVKSNGRPYVCCYIDNIVTAMQELTHTCFKVYICLVFNQNYYKLDFSPAHISEMTGLSLETVRRNFKELEKKGYIVQINEKHTYYNFYENKILINNENIKQEQELEKMTAIIQNTIKGKSKKEQLEIINRLDLNISLNN